MPENIMTKEDELKKAIIRVIVFFDIFDHPLAAFEIYARLNKKWQLSEVLNFLGKETRKEPSAADAAESSTMAPAILNRQDGFYCLNGREEIAVIRQARHNYGARKIKIARGFARVFSFLPFVEMIALANSLGQHNLRDGSDIDLFVVSSPRRVWLTRLYCTGLAKLANRRPSEKNKKDKICLSFYIASDHLCLNDLRLPGEDPYFDYWRQSLVLLYNKNKTYERFLKENNPDFEYRGDTPETSGFFDKLEILVKKIQLMIMPIELKSLINSSDGVVVNDSIIKLYRRDRRREYAEKYGNQFHEIFKESK